MKPIYLVSDRVFRLNTVDIAAAPPNNTPPHVVQSPTIEGVVTKGFGLALVAPDSGTPAVAVPAGFTLTYYRLIPTLGVWAAALSKTGVVYNEQLVNFDMGGAQAWFFVIDPATIAGGGDGDIIFCFVELP